MILSELLASFITFRERVSFITAYVRMTTQELDSFYHMTFQRAETRVWARFPCASWM